MYMSQYPLTPGKFLSILITLTIVCIPSQAHAKLIAPGQKWQIMGRTLVRTGFNWSLHQGSKVLWQSKGLESSMDRVIICKGTGTFAVTCANNVKLVSRHGYVLGKYPIWGAGDPRIFHQAGTSFVCSEGARTVGTWDQTNGLASLNWLRSQRMLRCVSFKTGRTLWTSNEIDFGVPIGYLKDGRVISLRILNPRKTFLRAGRTEAEHKAKYEITVSMPYSKQVSLKRLLSFTPREKYDAFYYSILTLDPPAMSATFSGHDIKLSIGSGEACKTIVIYLSTTTGFKKANVVMAGRIQLEI